MLSSRKLGLLILLTCIGFKLDGQQVPSAQQSTPVIVRIKHSAHGPSYRIGPKSMLLPALNSRLVDIINKHGRQQALNVIADDHVTIGTLDNLRGLIEKIGFMNVNYFVASEQSTKMGELIFGKVVSQPK